MECLEVTGENSYHSLGVVGPTPGGGEKQLMRLRVWRDPPTVVRPAIFRQHSHIERGGEGRRGEERGGEERRGEGDQKEEEKSKACNCRNVKNK